MAYFSQAKWRGMLQDDLDNVTKERKKLAALLQDACSIIEALNDADRGAWLEKARVAIAKAKKEPEIYALLKAQPDE
jgi:hypothetical protein